MNPVPADVIEIADPAVAAHHKEALKAFTHRLSEALMFDPFYVN
jgi:hypothetical protein